MPGLEAELWERFPAQPDPKPSPGLLGGDIQEVRCAWRRRRWALLAFLSVCQIWQQRRWLESSRRQKSSPEAQPRDKSLEKPSEAQLLHGVHGSGCSLLGGQGVPDVSGGGDRQRELTPLPRDLFPPVVYPLITVTFPFQSPITEPSSFLRAFC